MGSCAKWLWHNYIILWFSDFKIGLRKHTRPRQEFEQEFRLHLSLMQVFFCYISVSRQAI